MEHDDATEALTLALNRVRDGQNDALQPGQRIGRYLIEAQIGQGGMGTVFLAEQIEPVHRPVAIKMSRRRRLTSAERIDFERERQALAQLQHPAIAQIFDMGALDDGTPFFVMEYVAGQTLLEFCRDADLSIRERVDLLRAICAGINHAHQRGLVHCDLKPSNILVSRVDGRPQPKIIDFGTARLLDQNSEGENLYGTLAYMAPEQAELDALADTRSDVFSLGALLHEVLTESALRQIETPEQLPPLSELRGLLIDATCRGPIEPIKPLARDRLQELGAIIDRATRNDPESRYGNASELADDLQRWLDRRPVRALPDSSVYRARRFLSRNALASSLAGLSLLGLVGGLVATSLSLSEAREQRRVAEARQADLERVVQFQQNLLSEIDMNDLAGRMTDRLAETAGQLARRDGGDESTAAQAQAASRTMIERLAPVDAARDLVVEGILGQADTLIARQYTDNPAIEAALRLSLAQTLLAWQAFEDADRQIEAVRAHYARIGDSNSRDALEAETEAIKLRWWLQRFPEAYELAQLTRPRAEAVLGPEDDLSLYLLRAETALSSYVEGAEVAVINGRKLVERLRQVRGSDHPDTLRAEGDLLFNQIHGSGRTRCDDSLVDAFHDHLERAAALSGSDRRTLAVSSMNLGTCRALNGQYAEAARWMGQGAALGREVLGERHGITMQALNDRAFYLLVMNRIEAAEDVVDSLYANQRAILGEESPYLFFPQSYRLYIAGTRGRVEEALEGMAALLEEARHHPETSLNFLLWLHRAMGWLQEDGVGDLEQAWQQARAGLDLCLDSPMGQNEPDQCLFNELELMRLTALRGAAPDPLRLNELLARARETNLHPAHDARSLAAWLVYRFGEPGEGRADLMETELAWLLEAETESISIIQQRIVEDLRAKG
jgi:serine/threonine protein kinase